MFFKLCNSQCVEDETHFLLHCRKYNIDRDLVCLTKQTKTNNAFTEMFDADKIVLPGQIAKYIKHSYNLRFHTMTQ